MQAGRAGIWLRFDPSRSDPSQRQPVSTYSTDEAAQLADMGTEAVAQQWRGVHRIEV